MFTPQINIYTMIGSTRYISILQQKVYFLLFLLKFDLPSFFANIKIELIMLLSSLSNFINTNKTIKQQN